jgi:hypothetical protein
MIARKVYSMQGLIGSGGQLQLKTRTSFSCAQPATYMHKWHATVHACALRQQRRRWNVMNNEATLRLQNGGRVVHASQVFSQYSSAHCSSSRKCLTRAVAMPRRCCCGTVASWSNCSSFAAGRCKASAAPTSSPSSSQTTVTPKSDLALLCIDSRIKLQAAVAPEQLLQYTMQVHAPKTSSRCQSLQFASQKHGHGCAGNAGVFIT